MPTPPPVARVRAYDPAVVDQVLAIAADERRKLELALSVARGRIDAARERLAVVHALRDRIGDMVLDAERRHAQREAETALAVGELLTAADAEVDAGLAAARAEVARRKLVVAVRNLADEPDTSAVVIDLDQHQAVEVG